jgi:hypothetical protein
MQARAAEDAIRDELGQVPKYVSEQRLARALQRNGIKWLYEPTLIAIKRTKSGVVKEGFRPDFYLVEYDIFLEVTVSGYDPETLRRRRPVRGPGQRTNINRKRYRIARAAEKGFHVVLVDGSLLARIASSNHRRSDHELHKLIESHAANHANRGRVPIFSPRFAIAA